VGSTSICGSHILQVRARKREKPSHPAFPEYYYQCADRKKKTIDSQSVPYPVYYSLVEYVICSNYLLNLRLLPFIFVGVRVSLAGDHLQERRKLQRSAVACFHLFRHIISIISAKQAQIPGILLLVEIASSTALV